MAPCSAVALLFPSSAHNPDTEPDTTPQSPWCGIPYREDRAPPVDRCRRRLLTSARTQSTPACDCPACAAPRVSASWPAHRSRVDTRDIPATPAVLSSCSLSLRRVYPESCQTKTLHFMRPGSDSCSEPSFPRPAVLTYNRVDCWVGLDCDLKSQLFAQCFG